jgi:hypothetical protein
MENTSTSWSKTMAFDPKEFGDDETEGQQDLTVGTRILGSGQEVVEEREELSSDAAQQIATALTSPAPAKEEDIVDTTYLTDVDKRLEVAHYYRMLLKGNIFEDQDAASMIVERELRMFVRERLSILLNLKGEATPNETKVGQFTEEEVTILKVWAAALKKKPSVVESMNQQPAKRPPMVRRQAGGGVRPIVSSRPAPAQTPASTVPTPAPAAPVAPTPVAPTPVAPAPAAAAKLAPAPGQSLRRAILKPMTTVDGVPLYDKATGKPIMKNVTPQVRLSAAVPLPTAQAMSVATATASQRSFIESEGAALGAAIAGGQVSVGSTTSEEE